jgi:hypothetical protein
MEELQQSLAAKDKAAFQAELERRISLLKSDTAPSDVAAHNAEVNALLAALRQGMSLIPAFLLERYTQDVKAAHISRGPGLFSFAAKSALRPAAAIPQKEAAPAAAERQIEWTIHDLTDQQIEHICSGSMISVNNLVNCVLIIPNEAPAITLNSLCRCVVIAEHIVASARITACRECRVALGAKQLRIHETTKTDFYVAVFGNPIIEKCSDVRFAPLRGTDSGPWNNVKDFDCPTTEESSPNWSIIPEHEREVPHV